MKLHSFPEINAPSFLLSPQEVFPVQYGTKFDTALQALIAGLVCKLEQLFPVPNLSQVYARAHVPSGLCWLSLVYETAICIPTKYHNFLLSSCDFLQLGTMISTEASVLEACGALIPDPRDLRTLLIHQKAKGLLGVKGTTV